MTGLRNEVLDRLMTSTPLPFSLTDSALRDRILSQLDEVPPEEYLADRTI
jgi:hypothetical protein